MASTVATRALLLACLVACCAAADYAVDWKIKLDKSALAVKCGDTISFSWSGNTHDIVKNSKDSCAGDGKMLLGTTSTGSYKYTVAKDDTKLWFICTVGQHCANGQKLAVTATCGDTTTTTNTTSSKNAAGPAGRSQPLTILAGIMMTFAGLLLLV